MPKINAVIKKGREQPKNELTFSPPATQPKNELTFSQPASGQQGGARTNNAAAAFTPKTNILSGGGALGVKMSDYTQPVTNQWKSQKEERKRKAAEAEYYATEVLPTKYAGYNKRRIDAAMNRLKNDTSAEGRREYDWLKSNQYYYWTEDELKSGIKASEKKAKDLRRTQANQQSPWSDAALTPAQQAEQFMAQQKTVKAKSEASYDAEAMRRALEEVAVGKELAKLPETVRTNLIENSGRWQFEASRMGASNASGMAYRKESEQKLKDLKSQLKKQGYNDEKVKYLLDYGKRLYNNEAMQQQMKALQDSGFWTKAAASAASVPMSLAGGVLGMVDVTLQRLSGKTNPFTGVRQGINYDSAGQMLSNTARNIRGAVSGDMTPAGSFVYNTGMSIGDFLAASAAGPAGAQILLGGAAAQNAMQEAHLRGASDDEALLVGLSAGAAEAVFERVSLGKLKAFGEASKGVRLTKGEVLTAMAKQGFVEGTEEIATTLANTLTDAIIMADKSEINQSIRQYKAEGMSDREATTQAWLDWAGQLALDGLAGFASGGVTTGSAAAFNRGRVAVTDFKTGYLQQNRGDRSAGYNDVAQALLFPKASNSYKQAMTVARKIADGKRASSYDFGKLRNTLLEDVEAGFLPRENRSGVGAVQFIASETTGEPTARFVLGPISESFRSAGLDVHDAIVRADVLQDMINGEDVSNRTLKDKLKIDTPETRSVVEQLTGAVAPEGLKPSEAADFFREAMDNYRAERAAQMRDLEAESEALDEAKQQYADAVAQNKAQADAQADEVMADAMAAAEAEAAEELTMEAAEEDSAEQAEPQENLTQPAAPRETYEQFVERIQAEYRARGENERSESQLQEIWEYETGGPGILMDDGTVMSREDFMREWANYYKTEKHNTPTQEDLERDYQWFRQQSRETPMSRAEWEESVHGKLPTVTGVVSETEATETEAEPETTTAEAEVSEAGSEPETEAPPKKPTETKKPPEKKVYSFTVWTKDGKTTEYISARSPAEAKAQAKKIAGRGAEILNVRLVENGLPEGAQFLNEKPKEAPKAPEPEKAAAAEETPAERAEMESPEAAIAPAAETAEVKTEPEKPKTIIPTKAEMEAARTAKNDDRVGIELQSDASVVSDSAADAAARAAMESIRRGETAGERSTKDKGGKKRGLFGKQKKSDASAAYAGVQVAPTDDADFEPTPVFDQFSAGSAPKPISREGGAKKNTGFDVHAAVDDLSRLFKPFGFNVILDGDNLGGADGVNASVRGGTIRINEHRLNTGNLVYWGLGHELTHPSAASDATLAKDIVEAMNAFAKDGRLAEDLDPELLAEFRDIDAAIAARTETYTNLYRSMGMSDAEVAEETTPEKMREEVAGDWMGYLLSSQPILERMAGTRPDFLTQVLRAIDRIRGSGAGRNSLVRSGKTYRETMKTIDDLADRIRTALEKGAQTRKESAEQYSLTPVPPVVPRSDKWSPTLTTEQAKEAYPQLWDVSAEESEKRNPTQITSTQGTYRKIYDILQNEGFDGKILDASSGLGIGTQVGREEYGFDVDDIEPFPDASYTPKFTDYSALDGKYDAIISSAVLNVLPQDQRDALVVKMGELLNPGGRMFITTRGRDVNNLANSGKNIFLGPMEWIETARGSYQKGFTNAELKAYLEDALGDGFTVEISNKNNGGKFNNNTSIVVTKDGESELIPSAKRANGEQFSAVGPVTGFFNLSERVLTDVKQDKLGAASVVNMLRGKGVKAEEIKWLGIEDFLKGKKSVTKQELLDWIAANDLVIEEETLGSGNPGFEFTTPDRSVTYKNYAEAREGALILADIYGYSEDDVRYDGDYGFYAHDPETEEDEILVRPFDWNEDNGAIEDETHWSEYTTPGGENYREILFRLPGSDYSNRASEVHWRDRAPGVMAHARVQDFTTTDGKPILFVEEIQSDWHNAANEKLPSGERVGYKGDPDATDPRVQRFVEVENAFYNSHDPERRKELDRERQEILAEFFPTNAELYDELMEELESGEASKVIKLIEGNTGYDPRFPDYARNVFISNSRPRFLVEDGIIDENAAKVMEDWHARMDTWRRFDRRDRAQLRSEYEASSDRPPDAPFSKNYTDFVLKRLLREAAENGYAGIAWTTADMQSDRWSDEYAEGYRIEYDQDIPKFLNKFGKKFGAKVGTTEIWGKYGAPFTVPYTPITDSMREAVMTEGLPKFSAVGNSPAFDNYVKKMRELQRQQFLQSNPPVQRPSQTNSTSPLLTDEEKKRTKRTPGEITHTEVTDPAMRVMVGHRLDADPDGEKRRLFRRDKKWDASDLAVAEEIIKREVEKARETGDFSEARRLLRMHDSQMSDWGLAGHTAGEFANSFAGIVNDATDTLDGSVEHEPGNLSTRKKADKVVDGVSNAGRDVINKIRQEVGEAAGEPVDQGDGKKRPTIPDKKTYERNKQKGQPGIDSNMVNEPFTFEYSQVVGEALGKSVKARLDAESKSKTFLQQLQAEVMRLATERMPQKRNQRRPTTAVELLKSYVDNREFFDESWQYAREELQRQYGDEIPEAVRPFMRGWYGLSDSAISNSKIMRAALINAAMDSKETRDMIQKQVAIGAKNIGSKIADELIRQTGAKDELASMMRIAADYYVDEVTAKSDKVKIQDRLIQNALREIGKAIDAKTGPKSMGKLGATSAASKAVIRDAIINTLMDKYSVDQSEAENVAKVVGDRYDTLLRAAMAKRLESMFKERTRPTKSKQQTFIDRVVELTNLGAMESADYHDAAVNKLLEGYKTRRGDNVDDVLTKVYDYADRLSTIPKGDMAGLKELVTALNKERWTGGMVKGNEIHKTLQKAINNLAAQPGGDRFMRQLIAAQIRGIANDHARISVVDAANSVRYLSMLSKITTVARNLAGNTAFDLVETISNNTASTPMDWLLSKRTGRRTTELDRSYLNKAKRQGSVDGFLKAYVEIALDAPIEDGQNRWEMRDGRTFKMTKPTDPNLLQAGGNFAERLLSTWEKWQRYLLTATDEFAKGGTRAERQRQIDSLKRRGLLEEDALQDEAQQVALERTFQNQGKMTWAMDKVRSAANTLVGVTDSHGNRVGLGTALAPFARVPANIAGQALNYSPAGLAKSLVEIGDVLIKGKNATAEEQAKAVRDFGRGINGSALIALFAAAAMKGLLHVGGGSGDKDKDALERDQGVSGTQWNLSATARWIRGESPEWRKGDVLMNVSGLEPLNAPMAMGALIADSYADPGNPVWKGLNANFEMVMRTMQDLPAMSQINNIINAYNYSDEKYDPDLNPNGGPFKQALDAGAQGLGDIAASYVPNIISGIAQTTDQGKVRTTQTSNKRGIEAVPENVINAFKMRVPGLRETLPQALDSYGAGRQTTASPLQNALNSNILPFAINAFQPNPVSQELVRLQESGEQITFPSRNPPKSVDTEDGKKTLSPSERRDYQRNAGGKMYRDMLDAMDNRYYQREDGDFKADVWRNIKSYATAAGKTSVGGKAKTPEWSEKGTGTVVDKAIARAFVEKMNDALPDEGVTTGRKMQELLKYAGSNDKQARQLFAQILDNNQSRGTLKKIDYLHDPDGGNYSYQQLAAFYNAKNEKVREKDDGSGEKTSRTKAQLIEWATRNGFSRAQAEYLYKVFGGYIDIPD